jgi:hypothetical protein
MPNVGHGFVKDLVGPGITTSVQMEAADLGIARWDDARGANALMFGDNFTSVGLQGEWQSPSIVMYSDNFDVLGVPSVSSGILSMCRKPNIVAGKRSQLWPYNHEVNGPPGTFSTVLPTDFIKLGDWWYVHVMVTRGLGHELWTEWQRSKDLVTWEWVSKLEPPQPHRTMLTFDLIGDSVYLFGTGGLVRNQPIWAWRCAPEDIANWDKWIPLNGGNPVLDGQFGELCFRTVQGRSVLSYFDGPGYKCSARLAATPTDDWRLSPRIDYALGAQYPQLYGGYIVPHSKLDKMGFVVSQWNTATNIPYKSSLFMDAFPGVNL